MGMRRSELEGARGWGLWLVAGHSGGGRRALVRRGFRPRRSREWAR
uniref:Uncharacterized protein n=1 Tax=Arundo donax TaxID=35708 RepID=A0A0A9A6R1_ARUDO